MDSHSDFVVLDLMIPVIAELPDSDLQAVTPCDGWTVRDLVGHMNVEHEAIIEPLLGPIALDSDPRIAFGLAARRWQIAFTDLGPDDEVVIPKFGTAFSVGAVLGIHLADMVAHTWDLTSATRRVFSIPEPLVVEAAAMADLVPDTGDLRGPKGYGPALTAGSGAQPLERLLCQLGRDPGWQPPR